MLPQTCQSEVSSAEIKSAHLFDFPFKTSSLFCLVSEHLHSWWVKIPPHAWSILGHLGLREGILKHAFKMNHCMYKLEAQRVMQYSELWWAMRFRNLQLMKKKSEYLHCKKNHNCFNINILKYSVEGIDEYFAWNYFLGGALGVIR